MADINLLEYIAKPSKPVFSTGDRVQKVVGTYSKEAGHTTGVVVLARNVPIDTIVEKINFPAGTPAIADFTDANIGFRRSDDETVLDDNALADAVSFASARDYAIDILGSGITLLRDDTIGDLLSIQSDEAPIGGVDIIMTIVTGGANTGSIVFELSLSRPG